PAAGRHVLHDRVQPALFRTGEVFRSQRPTHLRQPSRGGGEITQRPISGSGCRCPSRPGWLSPVERLTVLNVTGPAGGLEDMAAKVAGQGQPASAASVYVADAFGCQP